MQRRYALWTLGAMLASCTPGDGLNPEHPDDYFTFYPTMAGLLRAHNTNGKGTRTLTYFPVAVGDREEITMHNEPFVVRSWAGNVITVSYRTSDKGLFLPWFRGRHNKPTALGGQAVQYTYEVMTESSTVLTARVDSISINNAQGCIGFFYLGKSLSTYPIPLVNFYLDRAEVFLTATHTVYEYRPTNKELIGTCILSLTRDYK